MSESQESGAAVRIRAYRLAVDQLGGRELTWPIDEGTTVRELLAGLGDAHDVDPDEFLVMVNGHNIKQLDGRATELSDGDDVTLSIGALPE